jgi:hypothetical protein
MDGLSDFPHRCRRVANHMKHLLELISQFPKTNPSTSPEHADMDVEKMFRQIRSRYKILCATLGVKPSLRAADGSPVMDTVDDSEQVPLAEKGREQAIAKANVWAIDS